MKIAAAADVKADFSAYLKASEKAPVVVTRNGKPVAILIAMTDEDELERLMMAHSPRLQAILAAARKRIAAGKGIPSKDFWAQLETEKPPAKRRAKSKKTA